VQSRGGKGSSSTTLRDDDFIQHIFIGSTHDYIFFISSEGKAYYLKVHEIPEASKSARGTHIKSLLAVGPDEEITSVVSISEFSEEAFILMATRKGITKKVKTSDFSNAKTRGITAIRLDNDDRLVSSLLTGGGDELMFVTRKGQGLRVSETSIRAMGRATRGVAGVRLGKGDELAGVVTVRPDERMLLLTEYGYGKRTDYDEFTQHNRGTKGQIAYSASDRTGEVVGVLSVAEGDEAMIITSQGQTIKIRIQDVSIQSRATMGVRVVDINRPDFVVGVARA
jgi:DNA gyrase subunit A